MRRSTLTSGFGVCLALCIATCAQADIIYLIPTGNAGPGLLGGNASPPVVDPGSGGVGPTGIRIDTDENLLFIDIQWGSGNGFTDLSDIVTMLHLHGPTDDPAPASFNQTGDLMINLGNSFNFNNSPTNGGLVENYFVSNAEIEFMLEGRSYINVHTALNPTGEIRGYLVPIPEPGAAGFVVVIAVFSASFLLIRRRRLAPAGFPPFVSAIF